MTDIINNTASVHSVPPSPTVNKKYDIKNNNNNSFVFNDKAIQQLLAKLDEGTETIMNLRSLLTFKTAELNELVSQLKLIDQVLVNVEHGTEQIELVLQDVISAGQDKLLDAEATLDSAIKSACNLYLIEKKNQYTCYDSKSTTSKNKEELKRKTLLLNKLNQLLNELGIDSTPFLSIIDDDLKVLQKAFVDLDLAKTIATTIKTNLKHRSTLLRNKNASIDQIKQMTDDIKNQVKLYKSYTRNAPLLINGKEDIITIIDREDQFISKKIAMQHHISTTTRQQQQIATSNKKKRQSVNTTTTVHNNVITTNTVHNHHPINNKINKLTTKSSPPPTTTNINNTTSHTNNLNNKQNISLLLISRHTSSSKAKSKEPKRPQIAQAQEQRGPGSTLRLRKMLAKRNLPPPTPLKMLVSH